MVVQNCDKNLDFHSLLILSSKSAPWPAPNSPLSFSGFKNRKKAIIRNLQNTTLIKKECRDNLFFKLCFYYLFVYISTEVGWQASSLLLSISNWPRCSALTWLLMNLRKLSFGLVPSSSLLSPPLPPWGAAAATLVLLAEPLPSFQLSTAACLSFTAAPLQLPAEHLRVTWSQAQQVLAPLCQELTPRWHRCTCGFVAKLASHTSLLLLGKITNKLFFGSTSLLKWLFC